ncbi:MAG: FtsX-like permease family protein [Chloroflexi bacterium]|nr:FtsX-like permease family protein [Chloroflexota bacterium]
MPIALRKVWRDLWDRKGRTALVASSIAVGVMAVGMILSSNALITRQTTQAQIASRPSHAMLSLWTPVGDDVANDLARLPGMGAVAGWTQIGVRWKPAGAADWKDGTAIAIADYEHQSFDLLTLRAGQWPGSKLVDVEFNHVAPFGVPLIGGQVYLKAGDRTELLTVGGTLRDPEQQPPPFSTVSAFYVTRDVMEALSGTRDFNQLRFTVADYSRERVNAAASLVEEKLSRAGARVSFTTLRDPNRHPIQDALDAIGLVLTVMAAASVFLSTFLVTNTTNAVIAQQIPQIGLMKTIGATRGQIAAVYLTGVAAYGLLGLAIAVPPGAAGGYALSRAMLYYFNIPAAPFEIVPFALAAQIGLGLLSPALAALWPVMRGTAISVREALAAYGVGAGRYGGGRLDRQLSRIQAARVPRLAVLMLRNTFRRTGRVALTEITLTMAGVVFMMVLSTHASLMYTIAFMVEGFGFDVLVQFDHPQRIAELAPLIAARPNVDRVEMWALTTARSRAPGATGPDSKHETLLYGIPPDSDFFVPRLVAGRALEPGDGHALLLNQKLAKDLGLGVGDRIMIDLGDVGESAWTIVGLIVDPSGTGGGGNTAYAPRDVESAALHQPGQATAVEIRVTPDTAATQIAVTQDVRALLESRGIGVSSTLTIAEFQQNFGAILTIITGILLIMAVLMAVVGSIGLSGTLSINVIERRREIGVMRAVGASSGDVALLFMGEGLLLAVLSWLPAIPLSLLAGRFLTLALGDAVGIPPQLRYSAGGAWLWLGLVVVLSLLASWFPARQATRVSVRESLAYE